MHSLWLSLKKGTCFLYTWYWKLLEAVLRDIRSFWKLFSWWDLLHYLLLSSHRPLAEPWIPETSTCIVTKIQFIHSQKWNCSASFLVSTFMYLWAVYVFPGSVCLFGCNKIGRPILGIYTSLTDTWTWMETEHYNSVLEITSPGIHKSEPDIYIGFSPALHLQCGDQNRREK